MSVETWIDLHNSLLTHALVNSIQSTFSVGHKEYVRPAGNFTSARLPPRHHGLHSRFDRSDLVSILQLYTALIPHFYYKAKRLDHISAGKETAITFQYLNLGKCQCRWKEEIEKSKAARKCDLSVTMLLKAATSLKVKLRWVEATAMWTLKRF